MKFINYLETISGVDVYGITSFLIFFIFFLAVSTWALKADKNMISEIEQLPLKP